MWLFGVVFYFLLFAFFLIEIKKICLIRLFQKIIFKNMLEKKCFLEKKMVFLLLLLKKKQVSKLQFF